MVTNSSANIPTAASNKVLMGQGVGVSSDFSTATYPATTTSQQILYSTANNVVGQLTTANSKFPATNSSGTLAMRALSVVMQVFTGSGTYTPTTGMLYCEITCLGGGGAGGGAVTAGASEYSSGGGGGAGEYAVGVFSAATIGASQSVTIGAVATGSAGANGGNGGNASVGALISANGGTGGIAGPKSTSTGLISGGGAGGTGGSGGSYRTPGAPGINGLSAFTAAFSFGGTGASSQLGSGGIETPGFGVGQPALGYGAGGNGANQGNGAALAGGNGTAGVVIVKEYVIA